MSYQTAYRSRYHRRRRRNSHYGVLVMLILLIVAIFFVTAKAVKGVVGAVSSGEAEEIVYQIDNANLFAGNEIVALNGGSPYKDDQNHVLVQAQPLKDYLGVEFDWEQVSKTATFQYKKNTVRVQADNNILRLNDETVDLAAMPKETDGVLYIPILDICNALGLQENELTAEQGDIIIVSRNKKPLSDKKIEKISEKALDKLGPARSQVLQGSIILRVNSDKLLLNGESIQMQRENTSSSTAVIEKDGVRYIPLKPAITALGGTAEYDGKQTWNIACMELESTLNDNGKAKVNGKTVKGDNFLSYRDTETEAFYVSVPLFGALLKKSYTDLGDTAMALTNMPLENYESQKTYLASLDSGLTDAAPTVNVPEADVYVALTFDDGPTGRTDTYPEGYTATLLDELKKRNVHATFFMCGYRIKDFNSHMERYLAEGHELGNHTMDHPDSRLTHLDAQSVYDQIDSNNDLIASYTGAKPTVMRPVGGGVNDTVKEQMKALGLPIINWNVDTLDWKTKTDPESVKNHIINEVKDGSIVLMHDLWAGTLPGVLAAIDELQSRTDKTYAFVTVSELAAAHGITLEPGTVYNNLSSETAAAIADGSYKEQIFD